TSDVKVRGSNASANIEGTSISPGVTGCPAAAVARLARSSRFSRADCHTNSTASFALAGSPCTARIRSMNACTTCAGLASAGGGVQPLRAAADASHTASKTARERITFAYRACPTTATPIWSAQFGPTCPRLAGSGPMGSEIFLRWAGRPLKWQPAALPRSAQHVLEQGSPDLRFVSGDNLQVLSNLAPELRGQ